MLFWFGAMSDVTLSAPGNSSAAPWDRPDRQISDERERPRSAAETRENTCPPLGPTLCRGGRRGRNNFLVWRRSHKTAQNLFPARAEISLTRRCTYRRLSILTCISSQNETFSAVDNPNECPIGINARTDDTASAINTIVLIIDSLTLVRARSQT